MVRGGKELEVVQEDQHFSTHYQVSNSSSGQKQTPDVTLQTGQVQKRLLARSAPVTDEDFLIIWDYVERNVLFG